MFKRGEYRLKRGDLPNEEWFYTVSISNKSDIVFDQIIVFYLQFNNDKIKCHQEFNLRPGQQIDFRLTICKYLSKYVVGFFKGEDLIAQIPEADGENIAPNPSGKFKKFGDFFEIS